MSVASTLAVASKKPATTRVRAGRQFNVQGDLLFTFDVFIIQGHSQRLRNPAKKSAMVLTG
jgi:hypothetical protein